MKKSKVVLIMLFFGLSLAAVSVTNSFFTSSTYIEKGIKFKFGSWIPTLSMSVSPNDPDGNDGFYKTTPCVTLAADIDGEKDGIKIYYEFSSDGDPIDDGIKYDGKCIPIPDGDPTHFQAQAVNEANDDWKSNVVSASFKVDTVPRSAVVINEIMWMGSEGDASDEWIELQNTTDKDIDLSNWQIEGAGMGKGSHIEIPAHHKIKAHAYFLILHNKWNETAVKLDGDLDSDEGMTHVSSLDLNDDGEILVLKDKDKNIVDTAWQDGAVWPAGNDAEMKKSMERNGKIEDGTEAASWHTCDTIDLNAADVATMKNYWNTAAEDGNCGTPSGDNL